MRWRIAIAVLAVIGIAGAVYIGTRPKKGTVEYHDKQFRKIYNDGRASRIGQVILRFGPERLQTAYMLNRAKRLEFHRDALLERGHLAKRTFTLTFRPTWEAHQRLQYTMTSTAFNEEEDKCSYGAVKPGTTNTIIVIDTSERIERWSAFVESIDVPETN